MTPICHLYSINVLYCKNMMKLTSQLHHSVFFHNHLCLSLFTQHLLLICYISSKYTCYQENVKFWLENSIVEKKQKNNLHLKKKKKINQSKCFFVNQQLHWAVVMKNKHTLTNTLTCPYCQQGTQCLYHPRGDLCFWSFKKKKKKLT